MIFSSCCEFVSDEDEREVEGRRQEFVLESQGLGTKTYSTQKVCDLYYVNVFNINLFYG